MTLLSVFLFFLSYVIAQTNPLLGTWSSDPHPFTAGVTVQDVLIIFPNGTYQSSAMANGQCVVMQTGTYEMAGNNAKLVIKDYQPKQFQNRPIRMPESESFSFEFIDKNTFRKTNIIGSCLMHRVTGR